MFDLTGSVRGLVDAGGAVTDTYSLELFGKQRASTGSTPNPYRYGAAWGLTAAMPPPRSRTRP